MKSKEAQLGCDVDGPSIMAAAAAAFVLWKLNLEVEGSLLLSQAVPLLCSLLHNAIQCCTTRGVASQLQIKVMAAIRAFQNPFFGFCVFTEICYSAIS